MSDSEEFMAAKKFWQTYGRGIVLIVIMVIVGIGVWEGWQYHLNQADKSAANLYFQFGNAIQKHQNKEVEKITRALVKKYPSTPYASLVQLSIAKRNVAHQDWNKAATHLRWVIQHSKEATLVELSRLRLSKVELQSKKYDEALKLLHANYPDSYLPLINELVGNFWYEKGNLGKARVLYQQAFKAAKASELPTSWILLKIKAVNGNTKEPTE